MGSAKDVTAVVDHECRVIGIEGLRVADSSIMPQVTNGNLNAPTLMIGEKASDHILGRDPLPPSNQEPWINPAWKTHSASRAHPPARFVVVPALNAQMDIRVGVAGHHALAIRIEIAHRRIQPELEIAHREARRVVAEIVLHAVAHPAQPAHRDHQDHRIVARLFPDEIIALQFLEIFRRKIIAGLVVDLGQVAVGMAVEIAHQGEVRRPAHHHLVLQLCRIEIGRYAVILPLRRNADAGAVEIEDRGAVLALAVAPDIAKGFNRRVLLLAQIAITIGFDSRQCHGFQ